MYTAKMKRLGSSVRDRTPAESLRFAEHFAKEVGVTRVTDITRLDTVGVPVFASVRPRALPGSLCVNAGKGLTSDEARIGAYMEAIEFAVAEPGRAPVEVVKATARDVLDGGTRSDAVLDFCPIARSQFDLGAPLACVAAKDVASGREFLVPAELVLLPYVRVDGTGKFGSNSNGLASGNSLEEAELHALLELVERDIRSFLYVSDTAIVVDLDSLPNVQATVVDQIRSAQLELTIRALPNSFSVACFEAILWDPFARTRVYLNGGYGCHLDPEIALTRAIVEALQSRLTWIHGARDDLIEPNEKVRLAPQAEGSRAAEQQYLRYSIGRRSHPFEAIFDSYPNGFCDINDALQRVRDRILGGDVRQILRVTLTEPENPMQVLRMIVPRLEYLDHASHRIGPRLRSFLRDKRV